MSTKMIHAALSEAQDRNGDYLEACQRGGRTQEAEAVQRTLTRITDALAEVEAIEKAAVEIIASDALEDWGPKAPAPLRDAFRVLHALAQSAAQRTPPTTTG